MRVVVTGASGNVGTSVLDVLADADPVEDVVAIARRLPMARDERARWRSADVARDDLAALFAGADVVIHLAWLIQPSRDERLTHGRDRNLVRGESVCVNPDVDCALDAADDVNLADSADALKLRARDLVCEFGQLAQTSVAGKRDDERGRAVVVELLFDMLVCILISSSSSQAPFVSFFFIENGSCCALSFTSCIY